MNEAQLGKLTPDEHISYLKHTKIPTVLVEGVDDSAVYRFLEEKYGDGEYDVYICKGRALLLEIFSRDHEIKHSPVVYLADSDMWIFSGVPEEYNQEIVLTYGYSIENDLYNPECFESLMSDAERVRFLGLISELAKWFACEVERFENHGFSLCNQHASRILTNDMLCLQFLQSYDYFDARPELVNSIRESYNRKLRGKTLLQGVLKILSDSDRVSKYSRANLLEMSALLPSGKAEELHGRLKNAIDIRLASMQTA